MLKVQTLDLHWCLAFAEIDRNSSITIISITYILFFNRQNEVGQTEFAGWARMGTVRLKRFDF